MARTSHSILFTLIFTCGFLRSGLSEQAWYERSLVGLEVGPTGAQFGGSEKDTGYAANLDGGEIARATKDCGGEYLVMWARDGDWAYYDSKLQPKPPGLGGRDPLREAVEEGKRLDLPIIAYCQLQYPGYALREHPEWRMVGMDGEPIHGRVCYRSDYAEFMKRMLDEQLAYGIDGFHLDMVDQGFSPPHGCWCQACKKEFKEQYGADMPTSINWDESWDRMLEFRYASSEQFEKELTAHIRSVNPKATVDYNYHGNPPFSHEVGQRPVQHAGNGDFVTGETGVWGFSALTVGLNAEFYRAATPGRPFQIAMQRGVRMYHDQTTRPLNDIRWELLTLLSHGGFVTIVDKLAFDGWLDPIAYERFEAVFDEVREKREHFGQMPHYDVGIYYSSRTRDWHGREHPQEYFQAFQGAHKAMVYAHIPWGVVLDENASAETLEQFRILLLPNAVILSPEEVELFTDYVRHGGRLILTGVTGTRGRRGETLGASALETLIGAKLKGELGSNDNWIELGSDTPKKLRGAIRADWPFLVRGPAAIYEPTEGKPFGKLRKPPRTWLHEEDRYSKEWPMSADEPVGPAVIQNAFGKGEVLTLAGSPDWSTASDHHLVEARNFLAQAVMMLNPDPVIRIEAPVNVQSVISHDREEKVFRVHLLGYNSPPQTTPQKERPYVLPMPIEEAPLYRATIHLDQKIKAASSANRSTELSKTGKRVELLIDDIHEVIILRY